MAEFILWHPGCLAALAEHATNCAWNKCYIFANISLESQWNEDSNDILSIRKCCQLFTYESNKFLCKKYVILPIQNNGDANAEKSSKQPLPFGACELPSTWMPGQTPLTMPKDSSIGSRTSTQLRNKVPIYYNGTLQLHFQNCPFPFDDIRPHLIRLYLDQPHHPKRNPDPISRFATVHYADHPTDR